MSKNKFANLVFSSFITVLLLCAQAQAQDPGLAQLEVEVAAAKSKFLLIRDTIAQWLRGDGAREIVLRPGLAYESYRDTMLSFMRPHAVEVEFITTAQEAAIADPSLRISIDGEPKTCRGFAGESPRILCNFEKFRDAESSGQYQLVHHEYAGLAGLERNVGPVSDYSLSGQLAEFVDEEDAYRLSQRKRFKRRSRHSRSQGVYLLNPMEAEVAYQQVASEGARALVRFSFEGAGTNVAWTQGRAGGERYCTEAQYAVSGELGLGVSGQNAAPSLELRFTIDQVTEVGVHALVKKEMFPVVATREIALGNSGKLRIDFYKISGMWRSDRKETHDYDPSKPPNPGQTRFFVAAAVAAAGAQLMLRADPGHGGVDAFLGGIDVSEGSAEVGVAHAFGKSFSAQLSIGGKADLSVLKESGRGWLLGNERSAFGKLSTRLDNTLMSLEAYLQGDVSQLQLGISDPATALSIKIGTRSRF